MAPLGEAKGSSTAAPSMVACQAMAIEVKAHITGTVWKIEVKEGDEVEEGDVIAILESMKMEMPVETDDDGTVEKIHVSEGQAIKEGEIIATLTE
jgi:acetyl-CoA carboxylase biotin carboxyl carrier protein